MTIAITFSVLAFIVLPMLGAMVMASEGEAGFGAWGGFCLAFWLVAAGWVIYIASHFIIKFW